MDCDRGFKLQCAVQTYAWGRPGSRSTVAKLAQNHPEFVLSETTTYAEYWMGTHPKGPSMVVDSSNAVQHPLEDMIRRHPSVLGTDVFEAFGGCLPFLFKVLSVNKALSIQAHPNKQAAEELHRKDPAHYPDDNHKPEMAIALTQFEGLCGFRQFSEIAAFLEQIPELQIVVGPTESRAFVSACKENKDEDVQKEYLKQCFTSLITRDESTVRQSLCALVDRLSKLTSGVEDASFAINELLLRLNSQFPGDVGCFCIYFMNHMILSPGQSMFLGPNLPHAYLAGDCIECMACSDNTVRAGLTPKFRDVQTLCEMLDYTGRSKNDNLFESIADPNCSYTRTYDPPVSDFAVRKIEVPGGTPSYTTQPINGPSIILVTRGSGCVENDDVTKVISLSPGTTIFCPAKQTLRMKLDDGESVLMFQAFCAIG